MFPILSVTLFVPLAGALLIMVIPSEDVKTIRRVGVAFAFATLVLAAIIWIGVMQWGAGEMRYEENYPWIPAFNIHFHLGVDGLSAPMVFLTTLLTTLSLFYSARTIEERVKEYYWLFLVMETSLLGAFLSLDLVMFYVFWEIQLLPMFLLIGVWGGEKRLYAARKFFIYAMVGSVVMLLAIIGVYLQTGTFNIIEAAAAQPFYGNFTWAGIAFWAFFVAFAIRTPSVPFHTWLPDAHTEAPTAGSVILSGVLLQVGAYGLIRVALPLFPEQFQYFVWDAPVIPVIGVASIVYGAMVCMAQWDLKRLIAYSSVAHLGYVTLGVCAAAGSFGLLDTPMNLNAAVSGLNGAAFQMFSHGVITGGLFFLAGMLYERTQTRDLGDFGGLARQIPHYYGITLVIAFAALGLPGLAGFWGEFFVFRGTVHAMPIVAFAGILGILFIAVCMLWKILQHLFLGELDEEKWSGLTDVAWWEKLTLWPLVLIIVFLGLYPAPLLDSFNAAMTTLLQTLP
ncbi:MAG TPA: NADH-quinone oxidoreductase subunit M [Chloroflexi bacterium]|nr:NADH-quinone oxidoreductase subunit M [Chloroflexota bacterium]